MEAEDSPNRSTNIEQSSNCEECGSNPWKYKCPGCLIRTCSLPCVQSHKRRTSCTGKKSYTEFVPLPRFDDQLLLSDYRFLEEANRIADSSCRWRGEICGRHFRPCLPVHLKMLKGAAFRRRINLYFMYPGMSRRKKNQSKLDGRRKKIFWTIEWRFHSAKVLLTDHGVDENRNLKEVLEKHLIPGPWKHNLKAFCDEDIDKLKLYLAKNPKGSRPILRKLEINRPLGPQMAGILIVEFPIIHVYLPSDSCEFEVEKEYRKPFHEKPRTKETSAGDTIATPKGIIFREEEMVDDDEVEIGDPKPFQRNTGTKVIQAADMTLSPIRFKEEIDCNDDVGCGDAPVVDMMHRLNDGHPEVLRNIEAASAERINSHSNSETQRVAFLSCSDLERCRAALEDECFGDPSSNMDDDGADFDFEFEQGVKDAYSSLLGELNTDDFLCLDGTINDADYREVTRDLVPCGVNLVEEELEEGEIPS